MWTLKVGVTCFLRLLSLSQLFVLFSLRKTFSSKVKRLQVPYYKYLRSTFFHKGIGG